MYLFQWILVVLGLRRRLVVIICSQTQLKVGAFIKAFKRAGIPIKVVALKAKSGVSDQPLGLKETRDGALGRIQDALQQNPNGDVYASGESGMMKEAEGYVDKGILVLRMSNSPLAFGETAGLPVPLEIAQEVLETGNTVGGVAYKHNQVKDPQNPHLEWSGISREEYYAQGAYQLVMGHRKALLALMRR